MSQGGFHGSPHGAVLPQGDPLQHLAAAQFEPRVDVEGVEKLVSGLGRAWGCPSFSIWTHPAYYHMVKCGAPITEIGRL
jgi:hypothetical protein